MRCNDEVLKPRPKVEVPLSVIKDIERIVERYAEDALFDKVVYNPDYVTIPMFEIIEEYIDIEWV